MLQFYDGKFGLDIICFNLPVSFVVRAQTFKNCKSLDFCVKSDFSTFITSLNDA